MVPEKIEKPEKAEKMDDAELLADLAERLSRSNDLLSIADSIKSLQKSWCDKAFIAIFENGNAIVISSQGEETMPSQGSSFDEARKGNIYVDNTIGKYSGFFDERKLSEEGYSCYMCVPFDRSGNSPATLCLCRKSKQFTKKDEPIARLATQLASAAFQKVFSQKRVLEAEALSQIIADRSLNILIIALAENGEILEANKSASMASGYTQAELKGMKLEQIFHGDLLHQGTKDEPGFYLLASKNGEDRRVLLYVTNLMRGGKKLISITGFDETARTRTSKDFYKDVVESIPDIIFTTDSDGEVKEISDVVETALGRSRESLVGTKLGSIVYEPDWKVLSEAREQKRQIRGVELRLLSSTNEPRWFELSGTCYRNPSGELIQLTGILREIHEKKKANENSEIAASLIMNASDAVVSLDSAGMISY